MKFQFLSENSPVLIEQFLASLSFISNQSNNDYLNFVFIIFNFKQFDVSLKYEIEEIATNPYFYKNIKLFLIDQDPLKSYPQNPTFIQHPVSSEIKRNIFYIFSLQQKQGKTQTILRKCKQDAQQNIIYQNIFINDDLTISSLIDVLLKSLPDDIQNRTYQYIIHFQLPVKSIDKFSIILLQIFLFNSLNDGEKLPFSFESTQIFIEICSDPSISDLQTLKNKFPLARYIRCLSLQQLDQYFYFTNDGNKISISNQKSL